MWISELIPITSGTTFIRKPENPLLIYYCHSHKELLNKWKSHPENQSSLLVLSWKPSILWVFERTGITGGFIYSDLLTKFKYLLQHWRILHKESGEYQSGRYMYIICGRWQAQPSYYSWARLSVTRHTLYTCVAQLSLWIEPLVSILTLKKFKGVIGVSLSPWSSDFKLMWFWVLAHFFRFKNLQAQHANWANFMCTLHIQ
jgi:hypothetical protein